MLIKDSSGHEIYEKIKQELFDLPGEQAHLEMFPKRGSSSQHLKKAKDYRRSAVLVLIYESNGTLNGVLTERQDYGGTHSGQMSFPGGKMESFDLDPVDTALRETNEEIGINREEVQIIGGLTDVFIPVSSFLVHPYIGSMQNEPAFIPDAREVKSVVTFELDELLSRADFITLHTPLTDGTRNILNKESLEIIN